MAADRQSIKTSRSRSSRGGSSTSRGGVHAHRKSGLPRIMILAAVVIVLGGAALFWPQRGPSPAGIGEQQTTVTAEPDSGQVGATERPPIRSGDVDITQASPGVVPEKPADGSTVVRQPAAESVQPVAKPRSQPAAGAGDVQPRDNGPYVVQVAAFGAAENADSDARRLQEAGLDARVHTGTNSSGKTIYRVRIGYFASKQDAQTFIDSHRDQLPSAIAVKR